MKPIYIHSAVSISAQPSLQDDSFELLSQSDTVAHAIHPNYRDFIAASAARRMAPAVKMGVSAAKKSLADAEIIAPNAILVGSGMGCMYDTEKFLNTLLANNEQFLTPTAFIQSTHNTVGAQIALGLECKAYNNTYVHGALSFESALIDAVLSIQEGFDNVLVGGVDELGTEFVYYKNQVDQQESQSRQVALSEGASFFVLSSKNVNNAVELRDIQTYSNASETEIIQHLKAFLIHNKRTIDAIDCIFLGKTGDRFDTYYEAVSNLLTKETECIEFKAYSGEFYTANAFAMWWATQLLKAQSNRLVDPNKNNPRHYKSILIYNQEKGEDHSFILLTSQ